MNFFLVKNNTFIFFVQFLIFAGLLLPLGVLASNIDAVNKYAQFLDYDGDEDTVKDVINFRPTNGGVTVTQTGTEGYAWGESVGWINTNPTNGNVSLDCRGDGTGSFSGYWWGENTGWINLSPTNGGLTIDTDGDFDGYVWSENYGWINFSCPGSNTCVNTDYACPTGQGSGGSGGGGGSSPYPLATCSLSPSPLVVFPGSPVEITWSTNIQNNNYDTAEIDLLGEVNANQNSVVVYPMSTQTYTGYFSGEATTGTAECSTTINVLTEQQYFGCTDQAALNYDLNANSNDGSCIYQDEDIEENIYGCLDPEALNYNSLVTVDNGSCLYEQDQTYMSGGSGETSAYIEEKKYIQREDETLLSISVIRTGDLSFPFQTTLYVVDETASLGDDYESRTEYEIYWPAGENQAHILMLNIIDDELVESKESLTLSLKDVSGNLLDEAEVIILDNDFVLPPGFIIGSIIALASSLTTLPFRVQNILLAIPAYCRKNQPWGTVFDAKNQEPLDPAYVQLLDLEGKEIASSITDMDGRYGFLVPPGSYVIKAGKDTYRFPSELLKEKSETSLYDDLYFGEQIEIQQETEAITRDIPMDPLNENNWNQKEKKQMALRRFFNRHDMIAHKIIDVLFVAGLIFSMYALYVSPVWYNILICSLYAVMIAVTLLGLTGRAYGRVVNISKEALKGAVVRVFNASLKKEIAHRVVGADGYYYMLVQKGRYYLTVDIPFGEGQYKTVYQTDVFNSNNGIIKRKIKVQNI